MCCVLFVWAMVLCFAGIGFLWSCRFRDTDSPGWRNVRITVMVLSGLIPLSCCVLPPVWFRTQFGSFPTGNISSKVHKGMTKEEVLTVLGPPHRQYPDDEPQGWYYYNDSYGLSAESVWFGPDGRVTVIGRN